MATSSWALLAIVVAAVMMAQVTNKNNASAFSLPLSPASRTRASRRIIVAGNSKLLYSSDGQDPGCSTTASSASSQDDDDDISSSSSCWALPEDWALTDQLPKFTVGHGEQTRTFWTQLAASTRELSSRSPDELYQRCQWLLKNNYNNKKKNDHQEKTTARTTLHFGPSPPLLSNWRMDLTMGHSDNRAVGTLEDGRVVWLHYHLVGRLPGDLFSDATSPSLMALIPGGYLEAVGGRIYELGEPNKEGGGAQAFSSRRKNWQDDEDDETLLSSLSRSQPSSEVSQARAGMAWWLPATTGTVSALLASTVLSACIGYGAGLGIIVDEGSGPHHHHHATAVRPSSSIGNQEQDYSLLQMIHYKSSSSSSSYNNAPSLEERKARAEYRVLREERMLQKISEQLERDQADLRGLKRIQFMEQQARSSNLAP